MPNCRITRALVSVSDKTGIVDFVRTLKTYNIEVLSTGGTAAMLRDAGIGVADISEYTGMPEIMDGRVKTMHPKVHGALLAVRDNPDHAKAMGAMDIKPIDLVVVNLRPLGAHLYKSGRERDDVMEQIDTGGSATLRSAARNYRFVAPVADPADYSYIATQMTKLGGALDDSTRDYLAAKAFRITSDYDELIASYLAGELNEQFPAELTVLARKTQRLRYGENPSQMAALYQERLFSKTAITTARQLSGKELSFNNLLDANTALELVREFDQPAAVIVQHANPCAVARHEDMAQALLNASRGDPAPSIGGVIAINRRLTRAVAQAMSGERHPFEVIVAPSIDDDALALLTEDRLRDEGARILNLMCGESVDYCAEGLDYRRLKGGFLVQTADPRAERRSAFKVLSRRKPSETELTDMELAWAVAKHVKTNATVLAKGNMVVGVGAGQMRRPDSIFIALKTAASAAKGAAMASDANLPFSEAIESAVAAGVSAIIHPGEAGDTAELTQFADANKVALAITGVRHFRH